MSDNDDIGDELLELLGGTEDRKRKKRPAPSSKSSASKRRKADVSMDTESENEPESEEQESNPYPLENKYKDEADRQKLLQLSEIEREDILAERAEEIQKIQFKRSVDQVLNAQNRGAEPDSVSKAAKRQHPVRGATKEKTRKLDELKARRKAKDEKKRTKTNSPKRDRSSSPMDMETSDEEEEDGQISKFEQEEEKERRMLSKTNPDDEPITVEDLDKCRLTRDMLAKFCMAPWFEDYVKGAWVRYLIGQENGEPVYRICEISNLAADVVKPYKVNEKTVNQGFDLKHGKSVRSFLMDKVSNSSFHAKEFERLVKVYNAEGEKLPSKRHLEKKVAQLTKLVTQPMTESDVSAMLARKQGLQPQKQSAGWITMEKSRLTQARTLALRREDYTELAEIDGKLKELAVTMAASGGRSRDDGATDMLAKVNERNRKANLEAVRKAELMEADRKRRERKLAAGGGTVTPQDPSARLKILPRLFNAATPSSRPGTPNPAGTPLLKPQGSTPRSISPLPPSALSGQATGLTQTFESTVIDAIEVDLGDF